MKICFWKFTLFLLFVLNLLLQVSVPFVRGQTQAKPITLQHVPFMGSAPFFIAEEEGLFSEQGLQINYVKSGRSADGIPALVQGHLDVLYGSMSTAFLNAMGRGAKIKFVSDKGYLSPTGCAYDAVLARRVLIEERKLDNPIQLRGRRIAMNPVSIKAYYIDKVLNTVGLSLDDIEVVDIPNPVMPEALAKGTIDLAATTEPWGTRGLQTGHAVLWMSTQKVFPDSQHAIILFGPSLLEKNPEIGKRFIVAYLKAVRQYNRGKTERNIEIMAKHTGLDKELLKKTCWPSIRNDGQINVESILDFQKWGLKRGLLDKEVLPKQFWDPGFIEYANKILSPVAK